MTAPTIHDLDQVPMWSWCIPCGLFIIAESHPCPSDVVRTVLIAPAGGVPARDDQEATDADR